MEPNPVAVRQSLIRSLRPRRGRALPAAALPLVAVVAVDPAGLSPSVASAGPRPPSWGWRRWRWPQAQAGRALRPAAVAASAAWAGRRPLAAHRMATAAGAGAAVLVVCGLAVALGVAGRVPATLDPSAPGGQLA